MRKVEQSPQAAYTLFTVCHCNCCSLTVKKLIQHLTGDMTVAESVRPRYCHVPVELFWLCAAVEGNLIPAHLCWLLVLLVS